MITLRQMTVLMVTVLGIGVCSLAVSDDAGKETKPASQEDRDRWMQLKLTSSQQIFADLTHGDFEGVEKTARRMQVLNLLEQWMRKNEFEQKSEYKGQLNRFEFATKELVRYAEDENIEGALEAYVDLSRSCVRCHQLIRDIDE